MSKSVTKLHVYIQTVQYDGNFERKKDVYSENGQKPFI